MTKNILRALVAGACFLSMTAAGAADLYLGVGGGIQHTSEWGWQLAGQVHGAVEANYTYWNDGERVGALALGYRWPVLPSFSLALGGAYVNHVTQNLLRHLNAYIEVRWRPLQSVSCQVVHYSSIGDDTGENLLLCGVHWGVGD